jgi:hypothetical protein
VPMKKKKQLSSFVRKSFFFSEMQILLRLHLSNEASELYTVAMFMIVDLRTRNRLTCISYTIYKNVYNVFI